MDDPCFDKVAILGVGLIGGSVGLALRQRKLARQVAVYSRTPATRQRAVELGAADRAADSLADCVAGAELVYVAAPVSAIAATIAEVAPHLSPGCLVTDAGSTKQGIVEAVAQVDLGAAVFCGGHPMAGGECHGVEYARAELFEGTTYVLTPGAATPEHAVDRLGKLAEDLGARVLRMAPERHDEAVAATSHLPHMLAWALMAVTEARAAAGGPVYDLAAGSWCSATRVARSDAPLWRDIVAANREAVLAAVGDFQAALAELKRLVLTADDATLCAELERLKQAKEAHQGRS